MKRRMRLREECVSADFSETEEQRTIVTGIVDLKLDLVGAHLGITFFWNLSPLERILSLLLVNDRLKELGEEDPGLDEVAGYLE